MSRLPMCPLTKPLLTQHSQLSGSTIESAAFSRATLLSANDRRDKKAAAQTCTPFCNIFENPTSTRYPNVDVSIYQRPTGPDNIRRHSIVSYPASAISHMRCGEDMVCDLIRATHARRSIHFPSSAELRSNPHTPA